MFDPKRHDAALARSAAIAREGDDFLLMRVMDELVERLEAVQREFEQALLVFARSDAAAERLKAAHNVTAVTRLERPAFAQPGDHVVDGDALNLPPASADLVVAPLTLHWSADLPGQLIQLRRALKPDGLLMAALPAPDTLQELRDCLIAAESELRGGVAQRVDAFTDIRDAGALLQRAGFALPVADREEVTVRYSDPTALVRDLRRMGATSQRERAESEPALDRAVWARAGEIYAERFSDGDGRIRATFAFAHMSGWVPHDSQQKPLRPGSAKARLADALKVPERKLPRS